jgi:outer membrane immunogenic protein
MKRILLATIAVAALSSASALAADLPRKAPAYIPPPPPPMTWTGCYIGGNIGGAFGHASVTGTAGEASTDNTGFAGGGQVGCDYQFSGGFVIGLRDMFDGSTNSKSGTLPSGVVANFNNQWFDTLTGRIGYAVVPNMLFYFQGGAAWAHTSTDFSFNGVGIGSTDNTRTGWTVGGGLEWMFQPHWSAFLEGNYMDFGSNSGTVVTPVGTACAVPGCSVSTHATEATVLLGLNYRFF